MNRVAKVSLEWLVCHVLFFAFFWLRLRLGLNFSPEAEDKIEAWMPVCFGCTQAYPMRRYVWWWAWILAAFVGWLGSFVFLMFLGVAFGFTLSCAQAFCILFRRPLAALLWVVLGTSGWLVSVFYFSLFAPSYESAYFIACIGYALALLPVIVYMERGRITEEAGRNVGSDETCCPKSSVDRSSTNSP